MSKLLYILTVLTALAVLMVSCSSEDEPSVSQDGDLSDEETNDHLDGDPADADGQGGEPPEGRGGFIPPMLSDPDFMTVVFGETLESRNINFGESVEGSYSAERPFAAFTFDTLPGSRLTMSTEALNGIDAQAIAIYGPRSANGLWGEVIAVAVSDEPDGEALIFDYPIPEGGLYLILVANLDQLKPNGRFRLSLGCRNQCREPACPDLTCQVYCADGMLSDENGCTTCYCQANKGTSCGSDADCPNEFVCSDGICEEFGNDDIGFDCDCDTVYEPICGTDGITYGNACEAACVGVNVWYEDECAEPAGPDECRNDSDCGEDMVCINGYCSLAAECDCPDYLNPVCGVDGQTYPNRCQMECYGVELSSEGACDGSNDCGCNAVWEPVCGVDGISYDNLCIAQCLGVEAAYEGECSYGNYGCSSDEECPPGLVCVYDEDCEPDEFNTMEGCYGSCEAGAGFESCSSDADCPLGMACVASASDLEGGGICMVIEGCEVTGCNGEICAASSQPTDCEWRPEYACFASASCELLPSGQCGWISISNDFDLETCQADYLSGTPCTVESDCIGGWFCEQGVCVESDCACPPDHNPVCGNDGNTYDNICDLTCAGVNLLAYGECP